jgi:hypothetical protein
MLEGTRCWRGQDVGGDQGNVMSKVSKWGQDVGGDQVRPNTILNSGLCFVV